jgi:hypothetical protein
MHTQESQNNMGGVEAAIDFLNSHKQVRPQQLEIFGYEAETDFEVPNETVTTANLDQFLKKFANRPGLVEGDFHSGETEMRMVEINGKDYTIYFNFGLGFGVFEREQDTARRIEIGNITNVDYTLAAFSATVIEKIWLSEKHKKPFQDITFIQNGDNKMPYGEFVLNITGSSLNQWLNYTSNPSDFDFAPTKMDPNFLRFLLEFDVEKGLQYEYTKPNLSIAFRKLRSYANRVMIR